MAQQRLRLIRPEQRMAMREREFDRQLQRDLAQQRATTSTNLAYINKGIVPPGADGGNQQPQMSYAETQRQRRLVQDSSGRWTTPEEIRAQNLAYHGQQAQEAQQRREAGYRPQNFISSYGNSQNPTGTTVSAEVNQLGSDGKPRYVGLTSGTPLETPDQVRNMLNYRKGAQAFQADQKQSDIDRRMAELQERTQKIVTAYGKTQPQYSGLGTMARRIEVDSGPQLTPEQQRQFVETHGQPPQAVSDWQRTLREDTTPGTVPTVDSILGTNRSPGLPMPTTTPANEPDYWKSDEQRMYSRMFPRFQAEAAQLEAETQAAQNQRLAAGQTAMREMSRMYPGQVEGMTAPMLPGYNPQALIDMENQQRQRYIDEGMRMREYLARRDSFDPKVQATAPMLGTPEALAGFQQMQRELATRGTGGMQRLEPSFADQTARMEAEARMKAFQQAQSGSQGAQTVNMGSQVASPVMSVVNGAWDQIKEPLVFYTKEVERSNTVAGQVQQQIQSMNVADRQNMYRYFSSDPQGQAFIQKLDTEISKVRAQFRAFVLSWGEDNAQLIQQHAANLQRIRDLLMSAPAPAVPVTPPAAR